MTEASEPPGSASSSPDEKCTCGCTFVAHIGKPRGCFVHGFHAFAPAEPDAAQEAAMDELTHLRQEMEATEPEAPEEPACHACGQRAGDWFDRSVCAEPCGSAHNRCSNCGAVTGDACLNETPAPEAQPPRRPPYAVAYAIEGGAQYEIALPGDATIRAHEGALIITHASAVTALTQARPMEGA